MPGKIKISEIVSEAVGRGACEEVCRASAESVENPGPLLVGRSEKGPLPPREFGSVKEAMEYIASK